MAPPRFPASQGPEEVRVSEAPVAPAASTDPGTVSAAAWASIAEVDPELWAAMEAERHRQADKIELIASENYTTPR